MGQNVSNYAKQGGAEWFIGGTINLGEETYKSVGLFGGGGTTASPLPTAVTGNFLDFRTTSTNADSADVRGMYWKHLFSGAGASGETIRAYSSIEAAGAVSVNGQHTTIGLGTSGTVTGQANAERHTFMVPNKTVGGTCSAVEAEFYAEGTTSNFSNGSLIRCAIGGDATGAALMEDTVSMLSFDGGTNASGNVVGALNGNEPTWASHTGLVRVKFNGVTAYLVAITL